MTVLSVTTVGALLATIQASALLIVLPDMMIDLHMQFMTMLWVLLVYLMVQTIAVPVLGRIADMFGRKKMYVLGFIVFAVGSLLCGLCGPSYLNLGYEGWGLICFRIIQAFGGSMLLANSTAMIADAFKKGKLGFGLGVNQIAVAAGIVIGPVVGGLLAPIGWEWIFLFNVPIALFGAVWAQHRLREVEWEVRKQKFDFIGTITFFIGLFGILMAVTYVSFSEYTLKTYALAVIGVIGIIAFLLVEVRAEAPMMDLHLFRNRDYAIGNLTNLLNGLCIGAATFMLIFYFQGPWGMDALAAGLLLIPSGLPMMIFGPMSGRWSDIYGPKRLILIGLILTTISLVGLALLLNYDPLGSLWIPGILMVVMGIGGGLFISPNASSVMVAVPPERRGIASGARLMLRNTGTMFSLAIAFPLVLSKLNMSDMMGIFLGGTAVSPEALTTLEHGLFVVFAIFAVISALSILVAILKPSENAA